MAISFNKVLVVDVEATCQLPVGEIQEIIEIGISEVDLEKMKILRSESIMVKPLSSKVNNFCTFLTGHTPEAVDKGVSLKEACEKLVTEWNSKNMLWISQGNFDREIFRSNCILYGVQYPFGPNHMNIAQIFSIFTGRAKQLGMKKQLNVLGLELEGRHHSGVSDSFNISRVLLELVKRCKLKI
jgi:inhibitor of KinA sporulation pathway (predicted exonuclease)